LAWKRQDGLFSGVFGGFQVLSGFVRV
jgi:hypothetical protein